MLNALQDKNVFVPLVVGAGITCNYIYNNYEEYLTEKVLDTLVYFNFGSKKEKKGVQVNSVLRHRKGKVSDTLRFEQNGNELVIYEREGHDLEDLDINYTFNEMDYILLGSGRNITLPNLEGIVIPKMIFKSGILQNETTYIDVTEEVQKFLGPKNDFHGNPISAKEMFPYAEEEYDTLLLTFVKRGKEIQIETKLEDTIKLAEEKPVCDNLSTTSSDSNSEVEVNETETEGKTKTEKKED